jgi:cysteine desulfurase/selenocysteine lyase
MEHHSNIVPWHFHRERKGAVLKWVDVREDGSFDLDAFEAALSDRTRMVAITHMSNVLGTVTPVKDIVALAHARDIPVLVDGSQGAVHRSVDVQGLGVDFYVFTGHKLYGPTGIGVLYGRHQLLAEMRPYQGGGEMIDVVTRDDITYNEPPHRFEAGTPPIVQAIGLGAAIDYLEGLGREAIAAEEAELTEYAGEKLSRINTLRLIGNAPGKGGIFSFELHGAHAHDVSTILDRYGIAVRAGTHCAMPLLERFSCTSTCRASLGLYSGKDDIDALIEGIENARKFFQ